MTLMNAYIHKPPMPRACHSCGCSYDDCTIGIRKGKTCCSSCTLYATHQQNAWERAHGPKLTTEVTSRP